MLNVIRSTFVHKNYYKVLTNIMQASASQRACHVKEETIASGKWIKLNLITYRDATGRERTWESAARTTTESGRIDAVMIMPLLRRTLHVDCLVVVKQYRPPLKAYTIEFPAGLLDSGEALETCALRELKEETGYTATVKHTSPGVSLDGGTENCLISIVTAEIDGDLGENKQPRQNLDESEAIEVLTIPVTDMLDRLNDFSKQGMVVDARVYNYAIGIAQFTKPSSQQPLSK